MRVVIDTNLIISGHYKNKQAIKIIDMCIDGKLIAVYSENTKNENVFSLEKFKPSAEYIQKIKIFLSKAVYVQTYTRIDICSDRSDNKFFEAAIDGTAQYIITNDKHILEHDGYYGVRVLRPREFLKLF